MSRDQKFYISFCILASACSDYAVGDELRLRKKLNWACTVLYYSLVHAARLMCFAETGDFPTGHKELSVLFTKGNLGVKKTWVRTRLQPLEAGIEPITEFRLAELAPENRHRSGQILTEARILRDDANYEGLLISHEYSHQRVTECFERLAKTLKTASEWQIPTAVEVFKAFIERSPRKEHWYAFLNWKSGHDGKGSVPDSIPVGEGLYYLKASLMHRGASERAIRKVFDWLGCLRREPDQSVQLAEEVHNNIVMSVFALKNSLFDEFETKIASLDRICGGQIDS